MSCLQALWRGNGANLVRLLPEIALKFSMHEQFNVMFAPTDGRPMSLQGKLAAGGATGMRSRALATAAAVSRLVQIASPRHFRRMLLVRPAAGRAIAASDRAVCRHMCLASCAGIMKTLLVYPLDVARVRIACDTVKARTQHLSTWCLLTDQAQAFTDLN
jgi:hypothetical protein